MSFLTRLYRDSRIHAITCDKRYNTKDPGQTTRIATPEYTRPYFAARNFTWPLDRAETKLCMLRTSSPSGLPFALPRSECTSVLRLAGRRVMSGNFVIVAL